MALDMHVDWSDGPAINDAERVECTECGALNLLPGSEVVDLRDTDLTEAEFVLDVVCCGECGAALEV